MFSKYLAQCENYAKGRVQTVSLVSAIILSVLAAIVVFLSTSTNIGISTDSRFYMGTAKLALAAGFSHGVDTSGHFPPLYPWCLALAGAVCGDLESGARFLNILCASAILFFIQRICWASIKNATLQAIAIIFLGLLGLLLADDFLRLCSVVLSEPLFMALVTGSMFALQRGQTVSSRGFLFVAGLLLGLATLTRHAGLFFLLPSICWVYLTGKERGLNRWLSSGIYLAAAAFPLLACKILVSPTGSRAIAFHWPGKDHWNDLGVTVASWFLPYRLALPWVGWLITIGLLMLCIREICRFFFRVNAGEDRSKDDTSSLLAGIMFFYLTMLLVTVVFIYFITPFDYRLLFPVHILLIIFLLLKLAVCRFVRGKVHVFFLMCLLLWFGGQALKGVKTVRHFATEGIGIGAKAWQSSTALQFLRGLPESVKLVSNKPEIILELLGRPCTTIPLKYDAFTMVPKEEFVEEMEALNAELADKKVILVWFTETARPYHPEFKEVNRLLALRQLEASDAKAILYAGTSLR